MKNNNLKIRFLCATVAMASFSANATLQGDATLNFSPGVIGGYYGNQVISGSYFALDSNGDSIFHATERIAMTSVGVGLTLGTTQDVGEIDNAWKFISYDGWHYTETALTVISSDFNTAEIDMSGWRVFWGAPGEEGSINLGLGTLATVECGIDCSIGDTFVLDYTACIPSGTFHPCPDYALHLEGVISSPSAVPVPAAVWLFGSGLICLFGFSKRNLKS